MKGLEGNVAWHLASHKQSKHKCWKHSRRQGNLTFQSVHQVEGDIGAPHLQHGCHLDSSKQTNRFLETCEQHNDLVASS